MEAMKNSVIKVGLGSRSYDIVIGSNLIDKAWQYIKPVLSSDRVIIVTDSNVAKLHLEKLVSALKATEIEVASPIIMHPGEKTKSFSEFQELVERIISLNVDRKTTLIALGGGVIGDITGFAASIILRGIPFIQIPTTLLAMVDSSVGGKTGINTRHGKNLVGSFYQPKLVLADVNLLDTLPDRELLAGYAEVAKYGFIDSSRFYDWLSDNWRKLKSRDKEYLSYIVMVSCKVKAGIVERDEKESGERALLNLGHTFAHALEAETGYSDKLYHGEAVAIGMVMAFKLAVKLGLCKVAAEQEAIGHLEQVGLPVTFKVISSDNLINHMYKDKKTNKGRLTFILPKHIGECLIVNDVAETKVKEILDSFK